MNNVIEGKTLQLIRIEENTRTEYLPHRMDFAG
jgi:hypothetical protein